MPSTINPDSLHRKIVAAIASTSTPQDHADKPRIPLAPASPPPTAAPMAFRSRGQLAFSSGNLLELNRNPEKYKIGMVHRLKTRLSSWKLLTQRSKTHTNLAALCPEDGGETLGQTDKPVNIARTCTVADISVLVTERLYQGSSSSRIDGTCVELADQHVPSATTLVVEPDPFAEEDMFDSSLNSVLRAEPDLLGSSTPRRVLSVLDPNIPVSRRQSMSTAGRRSSLVKHEPGINRVVVPRMRSSSELDNSAPFEIPQRRSSIVGFAEQQEKYRLRRSSVQAAGTEEHFATGHEGTQGPKSGYGCARSPSNRSSAYSSRRGSTAQDQTQLCSQRQHHAKGLISSSKRASQLSHKAKIHELRISLPPSPACSRSSKVSIDLAEVKAVTKSAAGAPKRETAKGADQNLRKTNLISSAPLLMAARSQETDLSSTMYKCFPVELGKKHPSPTKAEWEDMETKWHMGVKVRPHEHYF